MKKLTKEQWGMLDVQYDRTPPLTDSFSTSGEHYILIHLLNKFEYYPHSRKEAMELAERLLANGYTEISESGYHC